MDCPPKQIDVVDRWPFGGMAAYGGSSVFNREKTFCAIIQFHLMVPCIEL